MKRRYDRVKTYFLMNWRVLLPLTITALCFDGLMCFVPILEGKAIDSLKNQDFQLLTKLSILLLLFVLFVQINRFWKRYLVRVFANRIAFTMREVSFQNLLKQSMNYFETYSPGDILNRNVSDIYETSEGIRKMTTEFFDTFVLMLGYLISMFIMDYQITLLAIIFLFLSILTSELMKRVVYHTNKNAKEYTSIHKELTLKELENELYYRGLGASEEYQEKYNASAWELMKKNTKASLYQGSLEPIYQMIALLGVIVIAILGGFKVVDGMSIGVFSALLSTYLLLSKKAGKVGKLFNAFQGFKVSWNRSKGNLADIEITKTKYIAKDELALEALSFHYPNFTLPKIDMVCHKGQQIAICGRVHTGKSTVLKALSGLYDYDGVIRIGSTNLTEYRNNEKAIVSYDSSDVFLFSDTLEKNITLNQEGNLESALKVSTIGNEISLDKEISRTNRNISGGQQKRLQLARAFYHEADLILLDNPFQSVEPEMASRMLLEMKNYSKSIIFLVSNQKDILKNVDQIIYLSDKAVVGDYESLLKDKSFCELVGENYVG